MSVPAMRTRKKKSPTTAASMHRRKAVLPDRPPTAFITGIAGFAGSHLAEELLAHGWTVSGSILRGESLDNLISIRKKVSLVPLDILNARRCRDTIARVKPEYVFHLAAMASVGQSFGKERLTFAVNLDGTVNMMEAAGTYRELIKFVFVSSADAFGIISPKNKILTESQPLNPISPYGIAKAAAEHSAVYYHRQYGLPVVVARPFNHTGPRQAEAFVVPAFARQVALIMAGKQKPEMKVGDLSARRDISDVRDIVRGYRLLAERGKPGEIYHLCSGTAVQIKRILKLLVDMAGRPIQIVTDPDRLRKNDIPILQGSFEKARKQLGYDTRYSLKETLAETLAFWQTKILS
jgi:GDP-4-dehydro-6-deoxy-D-mannose reductase